MKYYALLFILFSLWMDLSAQTDSLRQKTSSPKPSTYTLIKQARKQLKANFLADNPGEALIWMDSLMEMENEKYAALAWDERWMLYLWQETFGNMLEEVAAFDENERYAYSLKIQPPEDSLYEVLDSRLYEMRFDLFNDLNKGFFTEEERLVTTLMIDYLLRLNVDSEDWNNRIQTFSHKFPNSRFNTFLKSTLRTVLKPTQNALNMHMLFESGTWTDELQRTLNPLFALDLGLGYSHKRWNYNFNFTIGGPRLTRDVAELRDSFAYFWPKKDHTLYFNTDFDIGYDLIHTPKIRIFPAIGAGYCSLRPPSSDESDNPQPDYYIFFKYNGFYWLGSITADIKFHFKNAEANLIPKTSYYGVRLRMGVRKLYLGNQNWALAGNLFFFSVGYNLHSFLTAP